MVGYVKNKAEWDKFEKAIDPKIFQKVLKKFIRVATGKIGLYGAKITRQIIKDKVSPPLHMLTTKIKGSSKPLVDQGDLFGSITSELMDWKSVFLGILKTSDGYDVARSVHDGTTIGVTDKMRGLFFTLWLVSIGRMQASELTSERAIELYDRYQDWKPLKKGLVAITIPSRPFLKMAFANAILLAKAQEFWEDGLDKAFGAMASGNY